MLRRTFWIKAGIGVGLCVLGCGTAYAVSCPSMGPCQVNDPAHYVCMVVTNNYDHHVTITVDGTYGCDADPDTYCSAVVPKGPGRLDIH